MAIQILCDLCGKPIADSSTKKLLNWNTYKIEQWNKHAWTRIDCHQSCIKKLFNIQEKKFNPPNGGSSMQDN